MFIKKVVKTYKGNGNSYTEYRFVRGYWTSVGPRHQTLLTVRDIPLPEDKWKQLADAMDCIRDILKSIKGRFILSYDDNPDVLKLYKGYDIKHVTRAKGINRKEGKSGFNEVIIANFKLEHRMQD